MSLNSSANTEIWNLTVECHQYMSYGECERRLLKMRVQWSRDSHCSSDTSQNKPATSFNTVIIFVIIVIIIIYNKEYTKIERRVGSNPAFYKSRVKISFRRLDILTEDFRGFHSLQVNSGTVAHIWLRPLFSTCYPIHYLIVILLKCR
jgi:hypothetical protein